MFMHEREQEMFSGFVIFFRVISWIVLRARRDSIHEITRNHRRKIL